MESFWDWTFVALWIIALIGTFLPFVPATLVIWAAALLNQAVLGFPDFSAGTWVALIGLGALAMSMDNIANLLGAARYGASRAGIIGAALGGVLGLFFFFPLGILIFPFLGALVGELAQRRSLDAAWRAAFGTLIGIMGGMVAKFLLHLVMGIIVIYSIF